MPVNAAEIGFPMQGMTLANLEAAANVPLMIGEYSFASYQNTTGDPDTVPGIYDVASTQQQRASFYENFIAPLYEDTPNLVGGRSGSTTR